MKPFKLDSEPKIETGFKIPDNYFENFQSNLIEKLSNEPIVEKPKVISIFRKRKATLIAVAAVLIIALMLPIAFKSVTKSEDLDSVTIENYLTEDTQMNQEELIGDFEPESNINQNNKELETQTLEDMLVSNPNIENLVIEN